ncbi:MAG: CBS domain-containing protein [Deltaproteobacteria bacterium]|jgi:tRNA nucleotidyltransferase (CCA-adding enzyme)|nr:CBS domain-containing protein [Deltaproteobacteria bacterium]
MSGPGPNEGRQSAKGTNQEIRTLITTHVNPDYDGVASMMAASRLYPDAVMVFPGGQEKNIRNYFIESILYLFNVARPKDIDLTKVELLVVVDTRQRERLGLVAPVLKNPQLRIHIYDHHPDSPADLRAEESHVAQVGATVTLMTETLREKGLAISPQEATMLALGLYEDTGSFTFSSTTTRDLRAAAELLELGADLRVVAELTARELTAQQLSLLNELIINAEIRQARGRNLAVAQAKRETHIDELAVLAHKMMDIMALDTLFLLVEMENLVQLVARSRNSAIDVGKIAQALGGGGHASAAAASFRGRNLEEARQRLEGVLSQAISRLYTAAHLMSRPPISLPADRPMSEAQDLMVRSGLSVLLVSDEAGKPRGYITEPNLGRAIYLGLNNYPIRDFMTSEFHTVQASASFNEVKSIVLDQKQRVLPVIDQNGLTIGVITRTDLIHHLSSDDRSNPKNSRQADHPFERSLSGLMENRLPPGVLALLRDLGRLAEKNDLSIYLVGGSVRDLIMLKPIQDLDLTLTGDMSQFISAFAEERSDVRVKNHPRFKTATLTLADGFRLDLSSARLEYYEYPGAMPIVRHASIRIDLQRRDFTINAMALSLNSDDFGRLLDFYRGYQDLKDGLIRVLHSLSFIEDPTRAFRAVRFEARLGFRISRMTEKLLDNALKNGFITNLHPRRIMAELRHICEEEEPGPSLKRLGELGLLQCVHPNLKLNPKQIDRFRRVARVKDWYRLTFGEKFSPVWLVWLLALGEGLDQEELSEMVENLDTGKKVARVMVEERKHLREILARYQAQRRGTLLKASEADRIFSSLSWPGTLYLMAMTSGEPLARAGSAYLTHYRLVKTHCTGKELIALGYKPGPRLQEALVAIREAKLDGLVNTLDEELELAEKFLRELPEEDPT